MASRPLVYHGTVRPGVKFDTLNCLQAPKGTHDMKKEFDIVLLDMAAIVHPFAKVIGHFFWLQISMG